MSHKNLGFQSQKKHYLHRHSSETEEIEFEETDHDLVVLVHRCQLIVSRYQRLHHRGDLLFIFGLAPTTWNIAQLLTVNS